MNQTQAEAIGGLAEAGLLNFGQVPEMRLEQHYSIPGGKVTILFARTSRGQLPVAAITNEPDEPSIPLTTLRDQVRLLNDLRRLGSNPRVVKLLIDADSKLKQVFVPALTIMDAA